jgi:hypothetical protein
MQSKAVICEEGLEEYPRWLVITGNLLMLVWIGLGTAACYFFNPVAAWIYLAAAPLLVFVVLRKLVCTNCYYYGKRCASGWGKLAALMFRSGDIERFNDSAGIKLAGGLYGLLTLVPLVLGTVAAVRDFSVVKVVVLVALLLIGFYSGTIGRRKSCAQCKMRKYCRGSLAKAPGEQ